jgi:hypothetical protein
MIQLVVSTSTGKTYSKVNAAVVGHNTYDLVLIAERGDELTNVAAPSRGLHELDLVGDTLGRGGNINALDCDKIAAALAKGWGILRDTLGR